MMTNADSAPGCTRDAESACYGSCSCDKHCCMTFRTWLVQFDDLKGSRCRSRSCEMLSYAKTDLEFMWKQQGHGPYCDGCKFVGWQLKNSEGLASWRSSD